MSEALSSASLDLGRHFHSFSPRNGIRFLQNGDRRSDLFERAARERYLQQKVSATKGEIKRDSNKVQYGNRENWKIERQVNECDKTSCTSSLRLHTLVA